MDTKLLDIVACPICHGRLVLDKANQQLVCHFDKVAYEIKQGIPVLLAEQAIPLIELQEDN
ncbi:Trm112 family protein [Pasteurella canis]|uniref:Trm112 family protein n=1 Tax=Pasteurella canis TaxID=753 RepID=UPI000D907F83|nr:Trm112 family protein [Pasteurella canis]MXN87897.1 Trm112 family protein [Pasteurella canis]UDW84670.1 Trm112 family protein [Pasteurella canis]SPY32079.1 tetraacyldisaccharide 4'-kinase [Pasteurella canis]SPY32082.1 tetraacyldisaccharide 4'-kinase [Pasteurella canis]SPY32937.1 tetraacyldisaccharide 4'-kinase [Pasteurella canis]